MSKEESPSTDRAATEPGLRPLPSESVLLSGTGQVGKTGVESEGVQALPKGHRQFLWQVHSYVNDYIRFSDSKAGVALAFDLAALGALFAAGHLDSVSIGSLAQRSPATWVAFAATVTLVGGAVASAWSVRPRFPNPQPRGFIFWESVKAHETPAAFHVALGIQKEGDLDRHLAEHVYVLAGISSSKYYWSAWSVLLSAVGGLLAGFRMLIG